MLKRGERPLLIYCAGGGRQFNALAGKWGLLLGAQLPSTVYSPIYFADQNFKNPNLDKYVAEIEKHKPKMATILDWDSNSTLDTTMEWANAVSAVLPEDGVLIIIPKLSGTIPLIPEFVNGRRVVLGYSVPTKYGGTTVPVNEFGDRPVHLLGGSPQKQLDIAHALNAESLDNNYIQKMATLNCAFTHIPANGARNKRFPMLRELGYNIKKDAPYFAFELSLMNLIAMWIGAGIGVRFATESDVPRIKRIAQTNSKQLGFVNKAALVESIARKTLLVAYNGNDNVVGFVNYRARKDGVQVVYEIATTREHKGAGTTLLGVVPKPIRLKCTTDNAANLFYEKLGFTHVGEEQGKKRALNIWHINHQVNLPPFVGVNSGQLTLW